jgi:hypothetical protein
MIFSRCGRTPGSIQRRWYGGRDAAQEKISPAVIEKILCDSPRRFYGL